MTDKNILSIVGKDKKILPKIKSHGKNLEHYMKRFYGTVVAIKKYDEKHGGRLRAARKAALEAMKKANNHRA